MTDSTAGGTRETVVSLTFDDGTADQYAACSLLAQAGLHATVYVNSNTVGSSPTFLSWEQLSELAEDGHEIGGHTLDHVDLTSVEPGEVARQVEDDREALIARGFAVTTFAYPYGARNDDVVKMVRASGYAAARRSWGLCPAALDPRSCAEPVAEPLAAATRWAMKTIPSIRNSDTLADLQRAVTRAESAGGGWVPFVFHRISDADVGNGYAVTPATFASFVDWLAPRVSGATCVRAVREVVGAS